MSVQTEITRINTAKADIITAIEGKGVAVPDGAAIDDLPGYVGQIQTGTQLPELTNPATAAHIRTGYQAIDANGNVLTGTYTGVVLPTLTNPATAAKILKGYQAISGSGTRLTGTYSLATLSPAATAEHILSGYKAYNSSGTAITGTYVPSAGAEVHELEATGSSKTMELDLSKEYLVYSFYGKKNSYDSSMFWGIYSIRDGVMTQEYYSASNSSLASSSNRMGRPALSGNVLSTGTGYSTSQPCITRIVEVGGSTSGTASVTFTLTGVLSLTASYIYGGVRAETTVSSGGILQVDAGSTIAMTASVTRNYTISKTKSGSVTNLAEIGASSLTTTKYLVADVSGTGAGTINLTASSSSGGLIM